MAADADRGIGSPQVAIRRIAGRCDILEQALFRAPDASGTFADGLFERRGNIAPEQFFVVRRAADFVLIRERRFYCKYDTRWQVT